MKYDSFLSEHIFEKEKVIKGARAVFSLTSPIAQKKSPSSKT